MARSGRGGRSPRRRPGHCSCRGSAMRDGPRGANHGADPARGVLPAPLHGGRGSLSGFRPGETVHPGATDRCKAAAPADANRGPHGPAQPAARQTRSEVAGWIPQGSPLQSLQQNEPKSPPDEARRRTRAYLFLFALIRAAACCSTTRRASDERLARAAGSCRSDVFLQRQ